MGEVYRARDTRLDRTVAIKILPEQFSSDTARRQRFEREAKTISQLNHPHICVLHDVGHQDGIDYLVMDCVEGETLAERLKKGRLLLEQVLKYGTQIADALSAAHANGIVHRDIKPANIFITARDDVKILDFGLAKRDDSFFDSNAETVTFDLSGAGMVLGTAAYMSPEQARGEALDARSDLFSFGAVLYEMTTGKRPFASWRQLPWPSDFFSVNAKRHLRQVSRGRPQWMQLLAGLMRIGILSVESLSRSSITWQRPCPMKSSRC